MKKYSTQDFVEAFKDREPGIQGARGAFAVVVPIVEIDGEAHILYELRSAYIDRQPGEVCFPGGEIEPGETPMEAALRETWEEIGIQRDKVNIIARLDILHPHSEIVIYPFLASIAKEALKDIKLSTCEVAEVFTIPVSFLLENEPYTYEGTIPMILGDDFDYTKIGLKEPSYNWREMRHEIISWEFEDKFLWGLTAQITKRTLELLTR